MCNRCSKNLRDNAQYMTIKPMQKQCVDTSVNSAIARARVVCACPAGAMWSLSSLLYDVGTCICMYTGLAYGPQSIIHAEQYGHL